MILPCLGVQVEPFRIPKAVKSNRLTEGSSEACAERAGGCCCDGDVSGSIGIALPAQG